VKLSLPKGAGKVFAFQNEGASQGTVINFRINFKKINFFCAMYRFWQKPFSLLQYYC